MINFNLTLQNPFSDLYSRIRLWQGLGPFKHKNWEFEIYRSSDLIRAVFELTFYQSHAGLRLGVALLSFNIDFSFYDTRHWNYEENNWYDDE